MHICFAFVDYVSNIYLQFLDKYMVKSIFKIDGLKEADFREIRNIMIKHGLRAFTPEYIRKVCKGERRNDDIYETALAYKEALDSARNELWRHQDSGKGA